MPTRPFRFGTGAYGATSLTELRTFVRKIEDYGYGICLTPDHFSPHLAPSIHLMAIADATKTLRIGSYVFCNDFRHPALLAKEAATLDLLSEGRFELGLGAGYAEHDYVETHIPLDSPGIRVSRLSESVQIIKQLMSEEQVTFEGKYYQISGLANFPKPAQTPHPPLLIAGGSKRILSLAAREANIVGVLMPSGGGGLNFADCSAAATAQRITWIREAAGERFDTLELNTLVFRLILTDHRQQEAERLASELGTLPEYILESIHYLVGTVDQICEDVQRWREQFGISYVAIVQDYIDDFAPVVARLAGQ